MSANMVGDCLRSLSPSLSKAAARVDTHWIIFGSEFCLDSGRRRRTSPVPVRTGILKMPTLTAAARLALVLGVVFGTGCNDHPLGGYDNGPQIDERGISVPVPPPSLKLEPVQRVDIEGELGVSDPQSGTRVFVYDAYGVGVPGAFVFAEPDGSFRFEGFEIDLTMNCLEVWSEEPGAYGVMSVPSFFTASIDADDQSVITTQYFSGCG